MDSQESLEKFATSKEFAQLLTLPIKYSKNVAVGKENEPVHVHSPQLPHSQEVVLGLKRPVKEASSPLRGNKRAKSILCAHWNSSPSNLFASLKVRDEESCDVSAEKNCLLCRSQSESAIKHAVDQSSSDALLLGDCSQRYLLPVLSEGKHRDLKEISSATLVDVLDGKYSQELQSFTVVDCRYPYEFQGGHIKGAVNLYTQQQIHAAFLHNKVAKATQDIKLERNILIFHCEFSSQRAPRLCRYLRSADRHSNDFPALHYPELYVLFGGYQTFFETFPTHCEPQSYKKMLDEKHKEDLRLCKSQSALGVVASKAKSITRSRRFLDSNIQQPKF